MNWLILSIKPVFARLLGLLNGIIRLMNLSLAPIRNGIDFTRQEEVLAQVLALQNQLAERDAELPDGGYRASETLRVQWLPSAAMLPARWCT